MRASEFCVNRQLPQESDGVALAHLCLTEIGRPSKGEENHLLASLGADVKVHGHYPDAGDLLDHRLHDWMGRFDQMGPRSLEQIPPVFGGKRFDQSCSAAAKTP